MLKIVNFDFVRWRSDQGFMLCNIFVIILCNQRLPEKISFEANLQSNSKLQDAVYIAHKKIRGPETVVFSQNGSLYTGLLNGQVVRIDLETDDIFKVAQIGDETNLEVCSTLLFVDFNLLYLLKMF